MVWIDAVCDHDERAGGWSNPPHVETHGVIIEDNEDFIRIAGEVLEGGTYRCVTTIPKVLVVRVVKRSED